MHTSNKIAHRRMAASQVIRWLTDAMPCRAKPRTEIQPCMMNKPHDKFLRTVSHHSEVRASEEVDFLSAPRTAVSRSNRIAPRTHYHSGRSCRLLIESNNHTQMQGCDDRGVIALGGLKHRNAWVLLAKNY